MSPDELSLPALIAFAEQAVIAAGPIALRYFHAGCEVENKASEGFDPVTAADRDIETLLRTRIGQTYPTHGIVGEEFSAHAGSTRWQWLIDPIDGTRAFISGSPLWGILLGLLNGERGVLGAVHQPVLDETFSGDGTTAMLLRGGERLPLRTRTLAGLGQAILYCTSPDMFRTDSDMQAFQALSDRCRMRRFGGDCYAYCLLASGHIDLVVEASLAPHDIMPLLPIIEGAGGVVTDWHGNRPTSGPIPGGRIIAAANAALHEQALAILRRRHGGAASSAQRPLPAPDARTPMHVTPRGDFVTTRLQRLQGAGSADLLRHGRKGLEKESLRVTADGCIAQTAHPAALGSALLHPQLTTDYAEALTEFVTPSFPDIRETVAFLRDLHIFVHEHLADELLWAASMPCRIGDDPDIRIAEYGTSNLGQLKHLYRIGLDYRYGRRMQTIAGVHFNYSLPLAFWPAYQELEGCGDDSREFVDQQYFALLRNFKRHSWLILYLYGDSPALCKSFLGGRTTRYTDLDPYTCFLPEATSMRMSDIGYKNKNQAALRIDYDSLPAYLASMRRALDSPYPEYEALGTHLHGQRIQLNTRILQIENEFYSLVRPKRSTHDNEKPSRALRERGVEYVEIRALDLYSTDPIGVHEAGLRWLEAFLIFCLLERSPLLDDDDQQGIAYNELTIALRGREPELALLDRGRRRDLREWAEVIFEQVRGICEILDHGESGTPYLAAWREYHDLLLQPESLPSARMLAALRQQQVPYAEYALRLSRQHQQALRATPLDPDRKREFATTAADSLRRQEALEAQPDLPFAEYLRRYLAQD
ncbi:MAG: glutamate--cysteine ligase [Gammaproteobacteria bacterium]|nr:glutamate--cysteine ligase [Gammaproteobacteria bacterium]